MTRAPEDRPCKRRESRRVCWHRERIHIEPGIATGAKSFYAKVAAIATVATFAFFLILPHLAFGGTEGHLILGSTFFLMLGAAPSAIGLALGLLIQGMFFGQTDLPQHGMNITTLFVPLFALQGRASKIIAPKTAYVDPSYGQALALSTRIKSVSSLGLRSGRFSAMAFWRQIWPR